MIEWDRVWCMPNKYTFLMKPAMEIINKYFKREQTWIDPFSGMYSPATITNDLRENMPVDYHMDALDFLKCFDDSSLDGVIKDPPYSPRQITECYQDVGIPVTFETTSSKFYSDIHNEISRIVKSNGIVISFGWNSNGVGFKRGFQIIRGRNIVHGGNHNDTIITVERKVGSILDFC